MVSARMQPPSFSHHGEIPWLQLSLNAFLNEYGFLFLLDLMIYHLF